MNTPATPSSGNRSDDIAPRKPSALRVIFRIVRWTTYAAAIITLAMVFHTARPPVISTSPQAAARVEQKVEAVEQAVASGRSAELRLDQTELNSYLASHLDISSAATSGQVPHRIPLPQTAQAVPPPVFLRLRASPPSKSSKCAPPCGT
jgi:hypothetical protein